MLSTDFYDERDLFERLTSGLRHSDQEVVFLVGSAVTAPLSQDGLGVPGVQGVIQLIRKEFDDVQAAELDKALVGSANPYQDAFRFLLGRRGPQAANGIIRAAMDRARKPTSTAGVLNTYKLSAATDEATCRSFDHDRAGWFLSPAVAAIGSLVARYPKRFGRTVLTTNFDPLVEVAISIAGGFQFRTVLHRDGNLGQSEGDGAHVIHLHGYWYGSDTLHTPRQLGQPRPLLKASLGHLIRNKIVVAMGYGGWDDVFAEALAQVVADDGAFPEVIWTFFASPPKVPEILAKRLEPGLSRGRVALYQGVDCHTFLPALYKWWSDQFEPEKKFVEQIAVVSEPDLKIRPSVVFGKPKPRFDREENPPNIDFYVGRTSDLSILSSSQYRVGFITGMGGQGKSALAKTYFSQQKKLSIFDYCLWRDCKEQSEKFEDQIANIIEALGNSSASSIEISKQSPEDMASIFVSLAENTKVLIVFDNIDHYVDLSTSTLVGPAGRFIAKFMQSSSLSQILFTCRPPIKYSGESVISHRLQGLDRTDARTLFSLRSANATEADIDRAHALTNGHALWLDLLAAQVAKYAPRVRLTDLLNSISQGNAELPEPTLRSIWDNLPSREKIVLQALAETLRPTTEIQLSSYLDSRLRYNQMAKAIRSLRDINLIVIRPLEGGGDGLELHPLIRAFIRTTFPIADRISFIDAILSVYGFFGIYRPKARPRPTVDTAHQWIEGAELSINANNLTNAFQLLGEVAALFKSRVPPGEFIRICGVLFAMSGLRPQISMPSFEDVFETFVALLSNAGRFDEAMRALEEYKTTLNGKNARYIHYCDMLCHALWIKEDYFEAIEWGLEGAKLKKDSGVDTQYSSDHNLALAQREAGQIDEALRYFMKGEAVDDIVDPTNLDPEKGGAFYGNVGRCYQLMGQIETAIVCYRKSAYLVESETRFDHIENQAFIRQWIGELLAIRGENRPALLFLVASMAKWTLISPPRSAKLNSFIADKFDDATEVKFSPAVEKYCLDWIKALPKNAG